MDKCSTELITLFVERACASDCGETARSLGLVSKYFRSIAEPLEFRVLVVSGLDQLKATLARLEKARERRSLKSGPDGKDEVDVQHLFISEYNSEHAAGLRYSISDRVDHSQHTLRIRDHYNEHRMEFWESVTTLVRNVSTTLTTLTALQQSGTFELGRHALGFLSGVHLAQLKVLTLKQRTTGGSSAKCDDADFVPPTAPLLQRLCINALLCAVGIDSPTMHSYLHPLLVDVHSHLGALTHMCIHDPFLCIMGVETIIRVICGSSGNLTEPVLTCIRSRRLPGKLVSATLHQAFSEHDDYTRTVYVPGIKDFGIAGLEVNLLTQEYIEEREWGYKALLAKWKGHALEQ
ncbi:hypothetical protein M0805_009738 [Coniferiporia weirii]|nr:hypothetical protein M0805_009738 [Coniferiporia weirii]